MKELQHLNKYFIKYKTRLLFGILITIVSKIFLLFTPRLIRESINIIDKYKKGNITELQIVKTELLENILFIIGAAIITGILTFFMRHSWPTEFFVEF